jgi:hypothetical protein
MSFVVDCGYLAKIQAIADTIWVDPMKNIDLVGDVEAARAVLENQDVKMGAIINTNKRRAVEAEWLQKCDIVPQSCSDDCYISGTDAEPVCKTYELECLAETSFQVPMRHYRDRTVEMQEAVATNMLMHKKALGEWLAQYVVTGLVNFAGVNQLAGFQGNVVGNTTFIAPNYWDDNIWGYFNQAVRHNKLKSPYMITGDNLWQLLFNRQLEGANANGKGNIAKIGSIRAIYQDPENVEAIAPKTSFLIHKTAVAFVNKAWNNLGAGNAENRAGQYWEWSEPLNDLPGVFVDVTMKEECYDNEFYQAYKLKLWGNLVQNPLPCNEDMTGVLTFECGVSEPN